LDAAAFGAKKWSRVSFYLSANADDHSAQSTSINQQEHKTSKQEGKV